MDKTLNISIVEARARIADVIINSNVPPAVMEMILENFLVQVRVKAEDDTRKDMIAANEAAQQEELPQA